MQIVNLRLVQNYAKCKIIQGAKIRLVQPAAFSIHQRQSSQHLFNQRSLQIWRLVSITIATNETTRARCLHVESTFLMEKSCTTSSNITSTMEGPLIVRIFCFCLISFAVALQRKGSSWGWLHDELVLVRNISLFRISRESFLLQEIKLLSLS